MKRRLVHITIGNALLALAAIALSFSVMCTDVHAQTSKKLAIAQTADGHWSTDALSANSSDVPVHVEFALCLLNGASADLKPGDAFRVQGVGQFQCTTKPLEFYTIDAQPFSETLLRFDDGKPKASFVVPPIGAIQPGGWLRISPVINDGELVTTVNTFATKSTRIFIDVYDARNKKLTFEPEICDAEPPVTQCALKTKFSVGSIVLSTWVFNGEYGPLYGFVAVSSHDGGNARVLPF